MSKRTAGEPPSGFQELRDRVLIHLWQIRKIQKKHPEYTMALLIAIASEALSRCLAKKGHSEFLRLLKRKYDVPEPVGHALFRAVRNGLAHVYDTALIEVGQDKVVVVIAWNRPAMHLRVQTRDWLREGRQRPGVYLDMETMWQDLVANLKKLRRALQENAALSRKFSRQLRKLQDKYMVRVTRADDIAAWQKFLKDRS